MSDCDCPCRELIDRLIHELATAHGVSPAAERIRHTPERTAP